MFPITSYRGKVSSLFSLSKGGIITSNGELYQFKQPVNGRQYEVGDEVTFLIDNSKQKPGYWAARNIRLMDRNGVNLPD